MKKPTVSVELPNLAEYWQERGIKVPRVLSDEQLQELEFITDYRANRDVKCVVCNGTGNYVYMGVGYECPDDAYGHPMMRLARWYWLHNIKLQYQKLSWDEWPTDTKTQRNAKEDAENYIELFPNLRLNGVGMTITGQGLGVGKTWLATAILKELIKHQGVNGWFAPFYEVKSYFQMEDPKLKRFLIEKAHTATLLVLDEVKAGMTGPMKRLYREQLEELIRPRTDSNLPTIVTSNLTLEQFGEEYPRIYSLLAQKNQVIELNGADARLGPDIWIRQVESPLNGESLPIS